MGGVDTAMLQILENIGVPILVVCCIALVAYRIFHSLRAAWVSSFIVKFESVFSSIIHEHVENLLKPLHSMESANWDLRNKGLLRILEINVRTGENLKYYPKNAELLVVDRNIYVHQYLSSKKAVSRLDHLQLAGVWIGYPEELKGIPSGSVDVVVASRVLCSAISVSLVLKEIHRVLAKGGKYVFIEHTHERHPHSILGIIQSVLTVSRIWPSFAENCHLNRNVELDIRTRGGFRSVSVEHIEIHTKRLPILRLKPSFIIGVATK